VWPAPPPPASPRRPDGLRPAVPFQRRNDMKKVMVIVPFPMGAEDLARREAQMEAVDLGPGIEFHYRPVRVGPKNYSSQHDMALADFSILDAGLDAQAEGFDAVCIDT